MEEKINSQHSMIQNIQMTMVTNEQLQYFATKEEMKKGFDKVDTRFDKIDKTLATIEKFVVDNTNRLNKMDGDEE